MREIRIPSLLYAWQPHCGERKAWVLWTFRGKTDCSLSFTGVGKKGEKTCSLEIQWDWNKWEIMGIWVVLKFNGVPASNTRPLVTQLNWDSPLEGREVKPA